MSIPAQETRNPIVCAVDRDSESLPHYRDAVGGLGLSLEFFLTATELRENVPLTQIMTLILDVEVDCKNAVSLQRDLLQVAVPPSVILTTTDRYRDEVIESLGLGAIALLSRPWNPALMSQYLKFAEVQYTERRKLFTRYVTLHRIIGELTDRQRRVLALAATGLSNKLIATKIDVSQRTVETERSRLLEAFGTHACADAMINYGEYQVLDRIDRMHKRCVLQRLGMHAATTMHDSISFGGSRTLQSTSE